MVGFDPVTNVLIWMMEEYSTNIPKTTSITEHLARLTHAYFIGLRTSGDDFNHEKPISFVVRYQGEEVRYLDSTWDALKRVLIKIQHLKRKESILDTDKIDYSQVDLPLINQS